VTISTVVLNIALLLVLLLSVKPLGAYMAKVMSGENMLAIRWAVALRRLSIVLPVSMPNVNNLERLRHYGAAVQCPRALVVYLLQRVQVWLPLNPQALAMSRQTHRSTPR